MRLQGKLRLGYFPLPLTEARRIRACLAWPAITLLMFTTFRCQCSFILATILLAMGLPLSVWSGFVLSMSVALL